MSLAASLPVFLTTRPHLHSCPTLISSALAHRRLTIGTSAALADEVTVSVAAAEMTASCKSSSAGPGAAAGWIFDVGAGCGLRMVFVATGAGFVAAGLFVLTVAAGAAFVVL